VKNRIMLAGLGGALIVAAMATGLVGCGTMSPSNTPIDCDLVKVQSQSGKTDAQIAADIGAPVEKVAACHGPEKAGNKSSGMVPSNY